MASFNAWVPPKVGNGLLMLNKSILIQRFFTETHIPKTDLQIARNYELNRPTSQVLNKQNDIKIS